MIRPPYVIDRLVAAELQPGGGLHHPHPLHHQLSHQSSATSGMMGVPSNSSSSSVDPQGLACVYLNEYNVVAAAFTLHSSEYKVIKLWKEQIMKAKELYHEAKTATARQLLEHRESSEASSSFYLYGGDDDGGGAEGHGQHGHRHQQHLQQQQQQQQQGGRRGSFRGSRWA